ncbi:hypothetical protein [Longirhabdus pacifica]|uniref:hypothetical protein n=1 Tax=Longirhabdus pacifica TaxID=2305227 RepID=UPI001008A1FD|nr:hypothetical protein [Longirhabdus pacifica]
MKHIVFVEYRIMEQHRQDYFNWVDQCYGEQGLVEIYEGSDQRNNFVEIWDKEKLNPNHVETFKQMRMTTEESSAWFPLHHWVKGGLEKLHIWEFNHIDRK